MDTLQRALDYANQFEHAHLDVADTRPAVMCALIAIAQELWRLNERAEAAEAYAEVQRQVAEYTKGDPR